jgi:NADH:ubiquinone oxidoreductase subunit E
VRKDAIFFVQSNCPSIDERAIAYHQKYLGLMEKRDEQLAYQTYDRRSPCQHVILFWKSFVCHSTAGEALLNDHQPTAVTDSSR